MCSADDFKTIASLHRTSIPFGFLSSLGDAFLSAMYRALSRHDGSCVLVEKDAAGRVIGFVAGSLSTRRCFRRIVVRHALSLGLPIVRRSLSFATIRRIIETLLYPSRQEPGAEAVEAELLSIAVSSEARGMGVGRKLVKRLEDFFNERGLSGAYKVVTSADDSQSNGFYLKAGFEYYRTFYHHGNRMNEYRKTPGKAVSA